jgi:osmotically-inducible protein OsmY
MKPRYIRTLGLIVGLVAVLSMASIAASEPLSDQQVSRQIEGRLSQDSAFQNIRVAVQADVVSLSGTVPSLWAKTEAFGWSRASTG